MRRSSPSGPEPEEGEGFLSRLKASASRVLGGLSGDQPRQALPLSRYRGQTEPVVPYHERRLQLARSRRRQHGSYALVFILVLLVLVVMIFYGLTWALGGLSQSGPSRSTATVATRASVPATPVGTAETVVALPTPAPGGIASPSPLPGIAGSAGATAGTTATPEARTYIVKQGDTPGGIAREFGISVDALMRANNITDARLLKVGDKLVIPPAPTATTTPTR